MQKSRQCVALALLAGLCFTGDAQPAAATDNLPVYTVDGFELEYLVTHRKLPEPRLALWQPVRLSRQGEVWTAWERRLGTRHMMPAELPELRSERLRADAIQSICAQLVAQINKCGVMGVYISVDPRDVEPGSGRDLRPGGSGPLRLRLQAAHVGTVRTVATGDRLPTPEAIDNPVHRQVRDNSPVQPQAAPPDTTDLLDRGLLDNYLYRLNRQPGRQVDVALAADTEPGKVRLDYLVAESRPWTLYAQASNTGTPSTGEWRQRIGGAHNQLTNHDDSLSFDYATASFDKSHAVVVSYERPLGSDLMHLRLHGSWSEYRADEVGLIDEAFTGETGVAGVQVIANLYQWDKLFVDLELGLTWKDLETDNKLLDLQGNAEYLLPAVGLRLERVTPTSSLTGGLSYAWSASSFTTGESREARNLGRLRQSDNWSVLSLDLAHSLYLEPVLNPIEWRDPRSYKSSTLAHELAWHVRGQYTPGDRRLLSQEEGVIGGFFSVRGYDESVASGDTTLLAGTEYRFHLPRILKPENDPRKYPKLFGQSFRFAPPQVYGRPDWDFVLRAFFDIGRAIENDRVGFEKNHTLAGAGVGLELQVLGKLIARVDWARALNELSEGGQMINDDGHDRIHTMFTLVW